MKKLIFIGLGALLAFALVTCDGIQDGNTVLGITNVEYSADAKSVTLYLEGGVPVTKTSRALASDLAKVGHDFFEVVLLADVTATSSITRASWEIGEAAGIKNVIRNVDYDSADPDNADGTNGAAVLFVGRKTDKALLAIGLLTHVDGVLGTEIISTTTKVTFTVAALVAGAATESTVLASSFITYDDPGMTTSDITTDIKDAVIDKKVFPTYKVPADDTIYATYQIGSTDITTGVPDVDNIDKYLIGVITESSPVSEFRIPRFPISGNQYKEIRSPWAEKTAVTVLNNSTVGTPFENPIEFRLVTVDGNDGFISLAFSVPVYAINDTATADNVNAITWYIKPGFGTNYYNIDDGKGSAGGALLLAVGDAMDDYIEIVVVNK